MIKSFRDKEIQKLWQGERSRKIDAAIDISDLRNPPGNRLESLGGDRSGQWSIRVNNRWRVCFVWIDGNAYDVEFVDYH